MPAFNPMSLSIESKTSSWVHVARFALLAFGLSASACVNADDSRCDDADCAPAPGENVCQLSDSETLEHGETIDDGCNECTCRDGALVCTDRACPQSCEVDGEEYADGDIIELECGQCACSDGELSCTDGCSQGCAGDECEPSACDFDGQLLEHGQTVDDGCNECSCNDGVLVCTNRPCGGSCDVDGELYQDGDAVPLGECDSCVCEAGSVNCTQLDTPACSG